MSCFSNTCLLTVGCYVTFCRMDVAHMHSVVEAYGLDHKCFASINGINISIHIYTENNFESLFINLRRCNSA